MKVIKEPVLEIRSKCCTFTLLPEKTGYIRLIFSNGTGADFYVASACDRDDYVDELIG